MSVGETSADDLRRWGILAAVCVALAVIVVDNTILNVAIPTIEDELGASTAQLQAVVNSYVVVFAGLLVAAGLVADRYGRRLAVLAGLGVLAGASALAAFASTAWFLVAARAVMGVGAALVMPGTLAILVHAFAPGERVKAFAAWSAVGSAAMAIGPLVGGLLVEEWGWPGIFLVNAVLAVVAMVLISWLVPESRDRLGRAVDLVGAVASTVAMGAFVAAIILVPDLGLASPVVLATVVLAVLAAAAFWLRQRRAATPMVDLGLYRDRRFAGASAAVAVLAIGTGSVLFVLTQHLQHVLDRSPLQAGLAVVPLAVGVVGASPVGARMPGWFGHRRSIATGFTVTASGFAVLAVLTPTSSDVVLVGGLFLAGAGSGLASPAVHATVLGAVPPDRAGMGSALNDTHQQLGIALGVALIGSVVAVGYRWFAPAELNVHVGSSLASTLAGLGPEQHDLVRAAHLAFTQAQSIAMLLCAAFAITGAVIAWCVLEPECRTS
ncbi:MFS transporter [Saccharopolyspora sp. NPDC000359]|uniref:MFS transporter n=1 Tax=Saccharopolyspora sp. NPDC000359 TaxID=3154251 RepID=UPI00331E1ADE